LLSRETVLLVEDEDLVRSLAQRVLESKGYRVFAAPCAADALELHARIPGKVDVLLTDPVSGRRTGLARTAHRAITAMRASS
jgi:two-component system cell cycle sensor histidine kinase/response regulator CckA